MSVIKVRFLHIPEGYEQGESVVEGFFFTSDLGYSIRQSTGHARKERISFACLASMAFKGVLNAQNLWSRRELHISGKQQKLDGINSPATTIVSLSRSTGVFRCRAYL